MEQHFLRNPARIRALIDAAAVRPDDRVVELGAGIGSVTGYLPRCGSLTLVDLDPDLARDLAMAFPQARVIEADAVATLPTLVFDVLLANLPHYLTEPIIDVLAGLPFRVAVLAVRADEDLRLPAALRASDVVTLDGSDFEPPQAFASRVIRVVRMGAPGNG